MELADPISRWKPPVFQERWTKGGACSLYERSINSFGITLNLLVSGISKKAWSLSVVGQFVVALYGHILNQFFKSLFDHFACSSPGTSTQIIQQKEDVCCTPLSLTGWHYSSVSSGLFLRLSLSRRELQSPASKNWVAWPTRTGLSALLPSVGMTLPNGNCGAYTNHPPASVRTFLQTGSRAIFRNKNLRFPAHFFPTFNSELQTSGVW